MFLASSFLRCRPVPFRSQAANSFIAPRLFRTSINRSFRQTNIKYASPSPSPPRWMRLAAKLFSLRIIITVPLDMVALALEKSFVSRSRLIRFAAKLFIYGFVCTSIYKGIYEVPKLLRSLPQREAGLGTALLCVPVVIWYFVGSSAIWKVRESLSPWERLAARFFIYVSLPISISTVFDVGREILSSYPKSPPRLRKSLDDPLSYQHDVLPQGYIRLISVKPGKPEDPIELHMNSIRFRPLDHTNWIPAKYVPRYEALSYTWDEDEKKDKIPVILNGKPFDITSNLHSALLAIQRGDNFSPFWIDAICIDQNDNAEKEQQLRIMHQIYKNATNVRVWLGSDDQSVDIPAGLALMSHCLTEFEQVRGRKNSKLDSDWDILHSTSWTAVRWRLLYRILREFISGTETDLNMATIAGQYLKEDEKDFVVQKIYWHTGPEHSSGWKAIRKILNHSYFTRSWIIQELVLSSNRSIFVGDYDITDILRFVQLLYATPEIQRELPSECRIEPEVTWRIHQLIESIIDYNGALDLAKLLATFRGKGSKMPEDQIYSLLGLTAEKNTSYNGHRLVRFPEIDYRQSIQKLCTDTTKYILAQNNNLDVLRMVNTHAKPMNEEQWPSWVPNFTSPLPGLGEAKSSYWRLPPGDASRTRLPRQKRAIHTENDRLLIYGHVLSEIRKPIRVVENNGRRNKELEHEKRPIGERQLPIFEMEFLPMSVWEDSEEREVHGTIDVKKGDLVVMVARSQSPLILRRLKDAQRDKKVKECEWPEYNIVGTAYIPELDQIKFDDLAQKIKWDFQKMAIV
ncbi:hypothetical protein BELL_0073g00140 [Botrytis elliptica]|uniref:Heterokaryon incompatibility domain-containing protein n=1 Tax=Botrytis elliptica TaxID=278938 RepID=A0A4Z1K2Q6_9HELO|nr:hypothetical protein BELL_0073g00140 [Botrytis elliptica]